MNSLVRDFFDKRIEEEINKKMLYYSYSFEYELVMNYVRSLLDISLVEFINFITENYDVSYLESKDVLQFSSLDDFTSNICACLKEEGDEGFGFLEIGKFLENDGIIRKDGAYLKYGENHSKTACEIGLLFCLSGKYFLSCLGYIFNDLKDVDKDELLARLFLRNKLIKRLIYRWKINGSASYNNEVGFLSESTKLRRKSNVKKIVEFIGSSSNHILDDFVKNCHFN